MQHLLDWLASLPPLALYAALALAAAIENFFPPFPADTVVAFGSFYAARVHGSVILTFLATLTGNLAGAMGVYALGRRYGAERLARRFRLGGGEGQVAEQYRRRGLPALFLSRFLPGVRALVPPFAGAARVPPLQAALAMGTASALWYGVITWLSFRVGTSWEALAARIAGVGRVFAIVAGVIVAVAALAWWIRRRRKGDTGDRSAA